MRSVAPAPFFQKTSTRLKKNLDIPTFLVFTHPMKMTCDLWKPVRKGSIYCSPACGGGCTYEAFLKASLEAEKLARRCGKGWEPRVWENLGWHYAAASKGNQVKVHPYPRGSKGYTVFFGAPDSPGGKFSAQGTNLHKTIAAGLSEARKRADENAALVREIQSALS